MVVFSSSSSVWHCQDHMDLSYDNDRCVPNKISIESPNSVLSNRKLFHWLVFIASGAQKYKTSSFEWTNEQAEKSRKQSTTLEKWIFLYFCLPLYKIHFLYYLSSLFVCVCVCVCLQMSPHSTAIIHSKFSSIVETSGRARVSSFVVQ